ncbi:GDP-mannose 4,6-dehydratase [Neptuniibacter sp. CAU 1671]|uniref:GDP-mannose 4,6-dehydratase n=1 Tax=Neptuniibacter sp. CAU 1671 TaxID=3032593 RepID=UPI0023DBF909|nr:GDP-mannose 4,6-dehydratase [Neptuniibacter sp. CAU 1671]MDF2181399.1 GDP-mannose 4,6-dehydratase [Neptuniibacter sp. CAU 1671]
MNKTALLTGLRGQDGSYLAELLLSQGYKVIGTSHQFAGNFILPATGQSVEVKQVDLNSYSEIKNIIYSVRPDEIYNLAARSSSSQLFDDPIATAEINGLSTVRFLEAIREISPHIRFFQAASSEVFAGSNATPQNENTAFCPLNAYGAAKAYAANMVTAYRLQRGLFATTAFLFNHESPRRSMDYVTRKISNGVAKIALGQASELELGNLDSFRDWGFAGDYVKAMWLMLQHDEPHDFVLATGITHSVREFCEIAFSHLDLNYQDYVRINPEWSRRVESIELRGDPRKARDLLNWQPEVGFEQLVKMMVDAELVLLTSSSRQDL